MYLYTCISVVIFLFGTVVVTNPTLGHYPFQINDVCAEMLFPDSCLLPKAKATLVGIDKIYIIHWGGNPDRERVMNQRLSKILPVGWQEKEIVSFVKSLDPVSLNVSMISCLGQFVSQADVKIGTVSLTAKHHLAYYDMLHHHYEIALVLEDDVDFDSSFLEKLYTVSSELKKVFLSLSLSHLFTTRLAVYHGVIALFRVVSLVMDVVHIKVIRYVRIHLAILTVPMAI